MTLAALSFAAYRLTQFVVWDSLLDSARTRLELWQANRLTSPFRAFVRQLLSCIYCIGFWLAVAVTVIYLTAARQWDAAPLIVHGIECWAVAGGQALLNRWDDSRPSGPGHQGDSY